MSPPGVRLAPVIEPIFHQCVILYTCSQSNSDGPVLTPVRLKSATPQSQVKHSTTEPLRPVKAVLIQF